MLLIMHICVAQVDVGPAADLPADFFEHAGAATPPQAQQPAAAAIVA